MIRAGICRSLPFVAAALLVLPALHAQEQGRGRKYKAPPPTCKVSVTVVKAWDGKPIEDAAVVFHPMKGTRDDGNMELKTNEDGKTVLNMIPVGDTVRIQVIADGYQTYGGDYELPQDTRDITIKLHRPTRQYSIYESHPGQSASNQSNGNNQQQGSQGSQKPQQ